MLNLPTIAASSTDLFKANIWEVSVRQGSGRTDLTPLYRVKEADLDASLAADEAA